MPAFSPGRPPSEDGWPAGLLGSCWPTAGATPAKPEAEIVINKNRLNVCKADICKLARKRRKSILIKRRMKVCKADICKLARRRRKSILIKRRTKVCKADIYKLTRRRRKSILIKRRTKVGRHGKPGASRVFQSIYGSKIPPFLWSSRSSWDQCSDI